MIGTLIAIIALIPYTSSQVIGLTLIFQNFGGFHYIVGTVFAVVTIALWAFIGGLRGVAITDALQGVFMILVAFIGFFWVGNRFRGLELLHFTNEFWTPAVFANFTVPWFFFALTNPQVLQRLFIPKEKKAFRKMVLFFGLFGLFYTLIVSFIGFATRFGFERAIFPFVADRDKVILELFSIMGNWLALPLALSIIFAAVSTSNSIILTLSSMVVRDLFGEKDRIWVGKGFIVILTLLVFLFSITRPSYIVELSVISSSILLCFLPLLFGLFHWNLGGTYTAVTTLIIGATTAILLRIFSVPLSSVYTLVIAFVVFFVVGMMERYVSGPEKHSKGSSSSRKNMRTNIWP